MHSSCSQLSLLIRTGSVVCWCALLLLAGCGKSGPALGKLVPVQGKITMPDGKPLTGGFVTFIPLDKKDLSNEPNAQSFTSDGPIEEDGSYALFTNRKPGAPLGKYRVVLNPGSDRKLRFAVPKQYFSQKKSPLEIEVTENKPAGGYDLKLQSQKGKSVRKRR